MRCHISREEQGFGQILLNEKPAHFSLTALTFNWTCILGNKKEILNPSMEDMGVAYTFTVGCFSQYVTLGQVHKRHWAWLHLWGNKKTGTAWTKLGDLKGIVCSCVRFNYIWHEKCVFLFVFSAPTFDYGDIPGPLSETESTITVLLRPAQGRGAPVRWENDLKHTVTLSFYLIF